jgi:hypothetical protein
MSGLVDIGAGATSSATVILDGVSTSSMVLATAQHNDGVTSVLAAVPANGSFTIYLNDVPASPVSVGWLVLTVPCQCG